jgi:integrase
VAPKPEKEILMDTVRAPKLTAAAIAGLESPPTGRRYVADGMVQGLQLMLTASGARSWVLRYRLPGAGRGGQSIRYTIGDADTMSLAAARREAERLRAVVAQGEDPAATRRADLTRERETPRMDALVSRWLEEQVEAKRAPGTARQYRQLWAKHGAPTLGGLKVPDVTVSHVDAIHLKAKATPTTANRVVAMLGSFFHWCEKNGKRPRHSNPARGVDRWPEEERERYLTEEEIVRFGAALQLAETVGLPPADRVKEQKAKPMTRKTASGEKARTYSSTVHRPKTADKPVPADPFAVAALRFALLSGWRISEVCGLRRDAISKERGTATLEKSKTGRSVRPLGAAALSVLDALPTVKDSPYYFPSTRRGFGKREEERDATKPMGVPRRLWESVRDHAELKGVRIHDLRHSFGASAADAGNSLIMIAALLGHAQTKTTERYAKARRDVRQSAADVISGNLSALLSGAPSTPVTPIERKRAKR